MNPHFIVAEVSKNWPADHRDPGLLCQRFEEVVNVNLKRGYRLQSFTLHRLMTSPDELNETIIAVFEQMEQPWSDAAFIDGENP